MCFFFYISEAFLFIKSLNNRLNKCKPLFLKESNNSQLCVFFVIISLQSQFYFLSSVWPNICLLFLFSVVLQWFEIQKFEIIGTKPLVKCEFNVWELNPPFIQCIMICVPPPLQADGKMVDGSLLGDANGVEPAPGRVKDSGKWQRPRFSRKALMKCCLVKWIIASKQAQDKGEGARAGQEGVTGAVSCHCLRCKRTDGWLERMKRAQPLKPGWLIVLGSWPQGQLPRDHWTAYTHLSNMSAPAVQHWNSSHTWAVPTRPLLWFLWPS